MSETRVPYTTQQLIEQDEANRAEARRQARIAADRYHETLLALAEGAVLRTIRDFKLIIRDALDADAWAEVLERVQERLLEGVDGG